MAVERYDVYDGDNVIFSGSAVEIKKRFGLYKEISIKNYCKNGIRLFRKYTIKQNGFIEAKDEPVENRITRQQYEDMNYLLFHLRFYGNTTFNKDPSRYVEMLKNFNINVRIIEHPKQGREKAWWYIERIK